MTGNPIPTKSRVIVTARDNKRCVRCGGHGNQWHHRRRRGVKDDHTHAACNGITLCNVCHPWCHANPRAAAKHGWIVSAHDTPHDAPCYTFLYGWALLNHDGTLHLVGECIDCRQIRMLENGLCRLCLTEELCHPTAAAAAMELCACRGGAGMALRRLAEREAEHDNQG